MQTITAFCTWKLADGQTKKPKLASFSAKTQWQPQMHAVCNGNKDHVSPNPDCSCRVYGFSGLEAAHNIDQGVMGICEHWGKAEVHRYGIRSEYAKIKAIYAPFHILDPKLPPLSELFLALTSVIAVYLICMNLAGIFSNIFLDLGIGLWMLVAIGFLVFGVFLRRKKKVQPSALKNGRQNTILKFAIAWKN